MRGGPCSNVGMFFFLCILTFDNMNIFKLILLFSYVSISSYMT